MQEQFFFFEYSVSSPRSKTSVGAGSGVVLGAIQSSLQSTAT